MRICKKVHIFFVERTTDEGGEVIFVCRAVGLGCWSEQNNFHSNEKHVTIVSYNKLKIAKMAVTHRLIGAGQKKSFQSNFLRYA